VRSKKKEFNLSMALKGDARLSAFEIKPECPELVSEKYLPFKFIITYIGNDKLFNRILIGFNDIEFKYYLVNAYYITLVSVLKHFYHKLTR
jgi:hypothetical protein